MIDRDVGVTTEGTYHVKRVDTSADSTTYERRSICPDCVYYVVAQLAPDNLK
jgi:hypothetical protein